VENQLVLSTTQHALIGHFFAVALGAHIVGFLYFLASKDRIAPRYRVATWLSMAVMAASGLLFLRLGLSWDSAFAEVGGRMVRTPDRFDGGLRYVNWLVTVPVLLVQVLYVFDLARARVIRLRIVLVTSGLLMVLLGYVGQFRISSSDSWPLVWGTLSSVPFVVLLVVLWQRLTSAVRVLPAEAGRTAGNLRFVFLGFWGLYPIAYLVQVAFTDANGAVWSQGLFTTADIGSKVLYGVLLAKVLRLRSAADGFGPALEPAQGAVGPRPEDDRYPDRR
jgi:bacteriorhodopsin